MPHPSDSGRLADVSVAVIARGAVDAEGEGRSAIRGLLPLFDEIVWVGRAPPAGARPAPDAGPAPGPLGDWIGALGAASAERVLLVDLALARAPEVLLALIAWPEADCLVPECDREAEQPRALLRRALALACARSLRADPAARPSDLLARLETVFVPDRALGIAAGAPSPVRLGRPGPSRGPG